MGARRAVTAGPTARGGQGSLAGCGRYAAHPVAARCPQEKLRRDFFGSLSAPGAKTGGAPTAAAPAVASPRTKRAGGYFGTSSVHISHEPTVAAMVAEQRKTHFELAGPVPAAEADKSRFTRGPATAPTAVARPSALGVDRSRVHLVSHFAISEMAAAGGSASSSSSSSSSAAAGAAGGASAASVSSSRRPSAAVAASDAPYAAKAAAAQSRKAVRPTATNPHKGTRRARLVALARYPEPTPPLAAPHPSPSTTACLPACLPTRPCRTCSPATSRWRTRDGAAAAWREAAADGGTGIVWPAAAERAFLTPPDTPSALWSATPLPKLAVEVVHGQIPRAVGSSPEWWSGLHRTARARAGVHPRMM